MNKTKTNLNGIDCETDETITCVRQYEYHT